MIVFRKTMDAALLAQQEAHNERAWQSVQRYGEALSRVSALQEQLSAWVLNKAENITPEQAAQMFYAQDDSWQAAFFNCMQAEIEAHHASLPPSLHGTIGNHPGVPAGEAQWYYMAKHLTDSGFETIEAMFEHAKDRRAALSKAEGREGEG